MSYVYLLVSSDDATYVGAHATFENILNKLLTISKHHFSY